MTTAEEVQKFIESDKDYISYTKLLDEFQKSNEYKILQRMKINSLQLHMAVSYALVFAMNHTIKKAIAFMDDDTRKYKSIEDVKEQFKKYMEEG